MGTHEGDPTTLELCISNWENALQLYADPEIKVMEDLMADANDTDKELDEHETVFLHYQSTVIGHRREHDAANGASPG